MLSGFTGPLVIVHVPHQLIQCTALDGQSLLSVGTADETVRRMLVLNEDAVAGKVVLIPSRK